MPPASNLPGGEKEQLHRRFSAAATALADLYRESSNSYEAGYRDALLFVQRYLQGSSTITERGSYSSPTFSTYETVSTQHMTQFLQNTIAARRERMAAVRGTHSLRRRRRENEQGNSGFGYTGVSGENEDATDNEDEYEEGLSLTPQSSPAVATEPPACLTSLVETAVAGTTPRNISSTTLSLTTRTTPVLNHEMEHVIHVGDPVPARLFHQPCRQRPRLERVHGHLTLSSVNDYTPSTQLRIGRQS
ncbi:hypothetical protein JKF63_03998 [Porcisia hertigi]|uniref:Uncharacterized protein n=1 Tax=Porcisia hertigi TaxID=2761500 RepID=A0A836I3U6_9TRYP|nr:hypothetical protein JKF63_03998 [Porcisia hertigi]